MERVKINILNGKIVECKKGTSLYRFAKENKLMKDNDIVLAKVNGKIEELRNLINENSTISLIGINENIGFRAYKRTLYLILIKAVYELFKESKITIEHSLSKGTFGEIHKKTKLTENDIFNIKKKMQEIIDKDIPINKICVTKKKAIDIFKGYNMEDKVKLLNHIENEKVSLYELDGRYDYFYGYMAYSTGAIKTYDLIQYQSGFILRFPSSKDINKIPKLVDYKKLSKIFYESEKWANILGVGNVGSLNDKVENGEITNIMRVSEALHEKKIAYIADMINERKNTKLVLIAGPSSSGKTTFSKRLGIQLRVNGMIPVSISLDDYFVDREHTPKDENGNYDFESIDALDLELFNKNLKLLMEGKKVNLPRFDFKTGKRVWDGKKVEIPKNGIIIVEGIHGLNEKLTSLIPKDHKFKIYISALTQLNLDDHNRIATTDVRIIRRIVRDYLSRGYGGEETLKMWTSIRRGEEKNIFVFQEEADVMFNSTLVYELCVLKKYALEELKKININSDVYYEALRLISFLNFFEEVDVNTVAENSILREFVGGSCFYKY